ncbi:ATM interactor [Fukomys damarensis]|uniref:ATM interactor n=1 Tax=Fukomys damarensis TaxID=885580 RepID=A0A091CWU0_FUKDA|nr:ATM interactor [Fukomys damarensis]
MPPLPQQWWAPGSPALQGNYEKQSITTPPGYLQKLLLPKPRVALVKLLLVQLSSILVFEPLPTLRPTLWCCEWIRALAWVLCTCASSVGTLILCLDSDTCYLKESLPLSKAVNPGVELLPFGHIQNPSIYFDIEELFSAANIQTQTEESGLGALNMELIQESTDIETQTDFLLAVPLASL